MNVSLNSLIIGNLKNNSPFISAFHSVSKSMISIYYSVFSNSISHFYYSQTFSSFNFNSISFSNYLKSPIKVDKIQQYKDLVFDNSLHNSSQMEEIYIISNCRFNRCHSNTEGGSVFINSPLSSVSISDSTFLGSRAPKAGAVEVIAKTLYNQRDCFYDCAQGSDNGNDASSIFSRVTKNTYSNLLTAHKCPGPTVGQISWYGVFILGLGHIESMNINTTSCHLQFVSGLAHFEPDVNGSEIKFYLGLNSIQGNSLTFINMNFPGNHKYGCIFNSSTTSGLLYVQNSTVTVSSFTFGKNHGRIMHECVGGLCTFLDCTFDTEVKTDQEKGPGFGPTVNCKMGKKNLQTPLMIMLDTALCRGYTLYANQDETKNKFQESDYVIIIVIIVVFTILLAITNKRRKFRAFFKKREDVLPLIQ